MKARFTTEQPAVRWQPLDNGMVDVTVCLNGQEKYLEYQPLQEKTLEQKLQEQDENIRMLTECLLEMSEAVYV